MAALLLAMLGAVATVGTADAQTAAALVLEAVGALTPPLQPFTEVPAGTTVAVGAGGKLVLQHYHTCRVVTVEGGRIAVAAETYAVSGSDRTREERRPCQRTIRLTRPGEAGGVVLRSGPSGGGGVSLAARPVFTLVGARAADFAALSVSRGGQVLLEASLDGRRFQWPDGTPPLEPGPEYELRLVPRQSGASPVIVRFTVAAGPDPGAGALVLLALD